MATHAKLGIRLSIVVSIIAIYPIWTAPPEGAWTIPYLAVLLFMFLPKILGVGNASGAPRPFVTALVPAIIGACATSDSYIALVCAILYAIAASLAHGKATASTRAGVFLLCAFLSSSAWIMMNASAVGEELGIAETAVQVFGMLLLLLGFLAVEFVHCRSKETQRDFRSGKNAEGFPFERKLLRF